MRLLRRRAGTTVQPDRPQGFDDQALAFVDALYAAALRLSRNPADAEDLVQETYLKAFRAADQFSRTQPEGLAVYDPPQHVPEHAPEG